jgi:P27 family predicted phage terminase small subunit
MRGRKPLPSAVHRVCGNPGKRKRRGGTEIAPQGEALKPTSLSLGAVAEWDRMAPWLYALGILTLADQTFFTIYCEAVATYTRANAKLIEQGEVVLDADGRPVKNPWLRIRSDAAAQIHRFGSEFGLSPSIRARFTIAGPELPDDDPAAKYFR